MRRLAETLGVVPMALYQHVADKDDLLAGMVDLVMAEFTAGPTTGSDALGSDGAGTVSWQSQMRWLLRTARRVVAARPWARRAIETRCVRAAAVLGHMDRLTRICSTAGCRPTWRITPCTPWATASGVSARSSSTAPATPGAPGCDEDYEFGFALDLLLAGIERLHRQGWSSRGRPRPTR